MGRIAAKTLQGGLLHWLKSSTWSLRVKLSRLISRHDSERSLALEKEQEGLVSRIQWLSDNLRFAQERHHDAERRHQGAEERCKATETARFRISEKFKEFKQSSIEQMCAQAKDGELPLTWDAAASSVNHVIEGFIRPYHKNASWGDRLLTIDKSMAFAKDPVFESAFATFRGRQSYDQYDGPHSIAWRLNTLVWAAREVVGLEGDFVECGVFKGDMSYTIAKCLGFENLCKTFYLYDSFEGFSPKYSSAADFPFNPPFLDIANKAYRVPGLYETVCERFADYPNFIITQGFLPDTLNVACPEKIAFLHVDLNSPAAEIGTLEVLFDRVVPGGIILLDDYGWIDFAPQQEAEDAFFASRGYRVLELPTGQGMVVKRGATRPIESDRSALGRQLSHAF